MLNFLIKSFLLIINLLIMKNVKNALSRNEMRNIFAGQLPGGGEFDGGKCKEKCNS